MKTLSLREVASQTGPFTSVYLPPGAGDEETWPALRRQLVRQHVAPTTLDALEEAMRTSQPHNGAGRALVTAADQILIDAPPTWPPAAPVARVSDLPYLLPLMPRQALQPGQAVPAQLAGRAPHPDDSTPNRAAFNQFLFEQSRPGGLAVDGLAPCVSALREENVDALVVSIGQLGTREVWVAGHRPNLISVDDSLRGLGWLILSERADEALPAAALATRAEIVVTSDLVPLTDGVGALLRNPVST